MDYREINYFGGQLDKAVEMLQEHHKHGQRVYIDFNGHKLYSDKVTMDSAYLEVTGKTKNEFDRADAWHEGKDAKVNSAFNAQIPALIQTWTTKGKKILDEKFHESWAQTVERHINYMRETEMLNNCLEIIKALNDGCAISEALKILTHQGHGGTTFASTCKIVEDFCDRGADFVSEVKSAM